MGAGCSGSKATQIQDTVNKITLNSQAKEHLKNLNTNSGIDKEKMQKLIKKGDGEKDGDVKDLDGQTNLDLPQQLLMLNSVRRKHQQLWIDVETNDIKSVETLLSKLGDSNQIEDSDFYDQLGQSMIHKAASMGHAEILMLLLERTGIKPDIVNSQLATPLHLACKNNRESVARFLIGCGVDVNMQDEHGQTPILICCIHGHLELAQLIIESSNAGHTPEPLEIDLKDHRGLTPLNCAAIKGDLKLSILLLEKGQASIEEPSPKGCTPLLYAARGGYHELVRYLLEKGASPLKQDNSGGTVLHHAIEKGHYEVLQVLIEHGVDVYSAIEIADNAGRTPIFEAIDNNATAEMIRFLTRKRSKGGFGARVNVLNYNGQSPLFGAVREGNMENILVLVEESGAKVDLTGGEVQKDGDDVQEQEEEYESQEEKYFMEAYKNATTPLHLACILGNDQILHYLIEKGANPNMQTNIKGYNCLHLAVLANKPEIIIELLTKSNSNPQLPDYSGRTLTDMIEVFIPSYLDSINDLLENLSVERLKQAADSDQDAVVATHYYNPNDEREIKGVADQSEINELYKKQQEDEVAEQQLTERAGQTQSNPQKRFADMEESEIEVEEGRPFERDIEVVFGRKIALGLIALNWKIKETALKIILKQTEKFLQKDTDSSMNLGDFVKACTVAIDLTCKEKVIKVLTVSFLLLNQLITGAKIEQNPQAIEKFKKTFIDRNIVLKLLQKSEEGNTRMTNKIHECLLDFSFHPKIGEAHVSSFILQRIQAHNKASQAKSTQAEEAPAIQRLPLMVDQALGSYKGLLAQLALLYKFVNSFGVSVKKGGPLNVKDLVNAILPSLTHQSQDVRNASTKILLDIQRLSGMVKEDMLAGLPDKVKQAINEKLQQVQVERNQSQNQKEDGINGGDDLEEEESISEFNSTQKINPLLEQQINEAQEKIVEKGQSKDWQERDLALRHMKEAFEQGSKKTLLQDDFLTNCTVLLKACFEENNISLYLSAIEVGQLFFAKALFTEVVMGSLQSLLKPLVLKTTDTNTRVRKKSVDLINQIWNTQIQSTGNNHNRELMKAGGNAQSEQTKRDQISTLIAEVITDQSLQEKAIIGRLGLFIKRSTAIESGEELNNRSHQLILGKNYEQLIEFACQWCSHKNTKVRQNALKLIIEICRLNSIDPRGQPFKARILNYILGLRPSLRDPLVKKINEVCQSEEESAPFIDVNELELNVATKNRSASMDVYNRRKAQIQASPASGNNLPNIGQANGGLPNVGGLQSSQPTIVLPHSEPLSDEQKQKAAHLIQLFGLEIVTCFNSQTWSTRQAAIEKVSEQLHNLDPNRRDAMSGEINRKNFPIEENFIVFLDFIEEGTKDPVLKNYISILELMQKALPTFFRYLQPQHIRKELSPLIVNIIKKTSDLKAKIREASINFCLYLSHQSPIGPEAMVTQVLTELELVLDQQSNNNVATNLGNSNMISSCLKLLTQFQQQTKILEKSKPSQPLFNRFLAVINSSLRHQNPQVRKEGELLFKTLYAEFGDKLDSLLVNQKQQITQKLLQEAKVETGTIVQQQQQEYNLQRAQTQIRSDLINSSQLKQILKGVDDETLQGLKLPNPKKRLKAIIEIKKAIQKEVVNANQKTARDLFEPLSLLMRQLLQDESTEIYLETLNLLKFVVGSLAPHLSTLDLHLMLGSFIGIIVGNTVSSNIRAQMASDKVIIFFAKHSNIGPFVVAKDIIKNIEKSIKALQVISKKEDQQAVLQDKKPTLLRFISILQLLLQHFSIVLCYQAEFYDKTIELLADTMIYAVDDAAIKSLCTQVIVSLMGIDSKLLDAAVSKLDVARKTPLRKTMIELDNQQRQGKNVITQDHHAFVSQVGPNQSPSQVLKETRGSIVSTSRTSLFSPGSTMRGQSPGFGSSQNDWSKKSIDILNKQLTQNPFKNNQPNDSRAARRMISLDNEQRSTTSLVGQSIQARQFKDAQKEGQGDLILPDIANPMVSTNYNQRFGAAQQSPLGVGPGSFIGGAPPKMSLTSTGGAGFNSNANYGAAGFGNKNPLRTIQNDPTSMIGNSGIGGGPIRPPLYVPTKRESGRPGATSSIAPQQNSQIDQGFKQFKTEFNSNLYQGVGQSATSIQQQPQPSQSYQKKPTMSSNSVFKPQAPTLQFEAGVKRYQDPGNAGNKGPLNEF